MTTSKIGFDKFTKLLALMANEPKRLNEMLNLFLTDDEKANLGLRYLIIKELLENKKTQRQIAKDLNVSIAKITRGSNELKRMNVKFLSSLQNLLLKS